jgi:hypothetical protein
MTVKHSSDVEAKNVAAGIVRRMEALFIPRAKRRIVGVVE